VKINVVSLFPDYFLELTKLGVVGRAHQRGIWDLSVTNLRDFSTNSYGSVDDRPYGGGAGMVMSYEPLRQCLDAIRSAAQPQNAEKKIPVICLSPSGTKLSQSKVQEYAELSEFTLVCGRYEGVDQRFIDLCVDEEVSVGDFVLSGGEPAALCLIDAVVRLLPQVLGNEDSKEIESFSECWKGVLDYPHYTRPEKIEGVDEGDVPAVLLQGDHKKIEQWRRQMSLQKTIEKRPDLMNEELLAEYERLLIVNSKIARTFCK
jgi:tRNA (guanine37-N1)-methyltransferase